MIKEEVLHIRSCVDTHSMRVSIRGLIHYSKCVSI